MVATYIYSTVNWDIHGCRPTFTFTVNLTVSIVYVFRSDAPSSSSLIDEETLDISAVPTREDGDGHEAKEGIPPDGQGKLT